MLRKSRVQQWLTDTDAPKKWEWCVLAVLLLVPFLSFCYNDTRSIICYEVDFVGAFLHGRGFDFYQYGFEQIKACAEAGIKGLSVPTYDALMHIALGIWGIPLYFYCQLRGIEVTDSFLGIVYGKAIFIAAYIFALIVFHKLCAAFGLKDAEARWGSYLFGSSILVYTAVCQIGQSDILGIPFILLGLLACLKNDKAKFIFWFALAIPFKIYALFLFVPLLLLREKRIPHILVDLCASLSVLLLTDLPFMNGSQGVAEKKVFSSNMLEKLTAVKLPLMDGTLPLIIVLLGLICVWYYLKPVPEESKISDELLFIPMLVFGTLFLGFDAYPYWFLHLAPYLVLAIMVNSKHFSQLFLLETVGLACLVLGQMAIFSGCFEIDNAEGMLLVKLFADASEAGMPLRVWDLLMGYGHLDYWHGVLYTLFAVCMGGILWACRPGHIEHEDEIAVRPYAVARLLINTAIAYIPIACYMYTVIFRI